MLSNQLSQALELNLTLGDHTSRTESTVLMDASSVLPTLVMEHEHICAIRVRFLGGYNMWSDLVKLRGKTVQENQLLKVSSLLSIFTQLSTHQETPTYMYTYSMPSYEHTCLCHVHVHITFFPCRSTEIAYSNQLYPLWLEVTPHS